MLKVGDAAPDFAVGDTRLHGLLAAGRVAVYFFPKAFTPGWTREAGEFRQAHDELARLGCQVVGVSTDRQETSARFRESLCLPFPLVGDADGSVARAYGVRIPVIGLARRVTFLVGAGAEVEMVFESQFDVGAHLKHVKRALAGA